MKKKYTPAELEIILLNQDIITTSGQPGVDDGNEDNGGNGIGGGHNPGGWV